LFEKLFRLPAFTLEQAIEVAALQAQIQFLTAIGSDALGRHRTGGIELGPQPRLGMLQHNALLDDIVPQSLGDSLGDQIEATAFPGRQPDAYRHTVAVALDLRFEILQQIDLVVDLQHRQCAGANLVQHQVHLFDMGCAFGIGGVDHMQQQVGLAGFLQGGAERLDQLVRQMTNEAHRVGHDDRPDVVQLDPPQGRIKGGKQLVGGIYRRLGEGIEQRGFASVGIANQGDHGDFRSTAGTTGLVPLTADLFQTLGDLLDARPQQSAVGFQLGFTRATQTNTALLPLQVSPAADQTGTQVVQLGQLDLQLALMGPGTLGENIQDQTGTVDDTAFQLTLEVALLARCQHMVEDDQVTFACLDQGPQLFHLAGADKKTGTGLIAGNGQEIDNVRPGRTHQLQKLMRVFTAL